MLDIVHVAVLRPLDDLLRVVYHVPEEDEQTKVNLQGRIKLIKEYARSN